MDEAEIHRMANSVDVKGRRKAAKQLSEFLFRSKGEWDGLHRLAQNGDKKVRMMTAWALGPAFSYILDKDTAWSDLHRLTQDEDKEVRGKAAGAIGPAFLHIPYKDAAWSDLHRLTQDEDKEVRRKGARALVYAFSEVPDKNTVWSDLHRLTQDENCDVRWSAADVLISVFSNIPDKDVAWSDLIRLTQEGDLDVRALATVFSEVPDKGAAWSDLIRLTQEGDKEVLWSAAGVLVSVFSEVPDKNAAWSDLIRLTQEGGRGARALVSAFSHIPDKDAAWSDLIQLAQDEDKEVRWRGAWVLVSVFSEVPDKNAAWSVLIRLTKDECSNVRMQAADALGSCFSVVPDKNTACFDLHHLTQDENSYVRKGAADALGSCFSAVPDKNAAWFDLIRLTQDKNSDVRMYAYHSLGSASVYKATETGDEEKFRDELKKAIDYFESSSLEVSFESSNPAQFCLPFYLSYYAVISGKQEAEAEAAKYLGEAKKATKGSKSRESLLKAVENLANALEEAQKPDFREKQEHLRACRQHCDHTAELADSARVKSPVAAAALMRGIPIVGVKVKEIIAEIQEKAKEACRQAQGTPAEGIACAVSQEVQKWRIDNQDEMTQKVDNLVFCLKSKIPENPQNKHIHEKIEQIREESNMTKQYEMVSLLIALIPTASVHTGDIINAEVTASDDSQVVVKGNENKNASDNALASKKSLIERINTPVTFGGFIGFVIGGIGSYLYPTQPISLIGIISVGIAVFAAIIFSIFNKE